MNETRHGERTPAIPICLDLSPYRLDVCSQPENKRRKSAFFSFLCLECKERQCSGLVFCASFFVRETVQKNENLKATTLVLVSSKGKWGDEDAARFGQR